LRYTWAGSFNTFRPRHGQLLTNAWPTEWRWRPPELGPAARRNSAAPTDWACGPAGLRLKDIGVARSPFCCEKCLDTGSDFCAIYIDGTTAPKPDRLLAKVPDLGDILRDSLLHRKTFTPNAAPNAPAASASPMGLERELSRRQEPADHPPPRPIAPGPPPTQELP
jgi:hypothetical protein